MILILILYGQKVEGFAHVDQFHTNSKFFDPELVAPTLPDYYQFGVSLLTKFKSDSYPHIWTTDFSFPVHFRYQPPTPLGSEAEFSIENPTIYLLLNEAVSDQLPWTYTHRRPFGTPAKLFTVAEQVVKSRPVENSVDSLKFVMPTGNMSHEPYVKIANLSAIILGAIFILRKLLF